MVLSYKPLNLIIMELFILIFLILVIIGAFIYTRKILRMCEDIHDIRAGYYSQKDFEGSFILLLSVGEKEKAKELLMKNMAQTPFFHNSFKGNMGTDMDKSRQMFMKRYEVYLKAVNLEIDFSVVDGFLQDKKRVQNAVKPSASLPHE